MKAGVKSIEKFVIEVERGETKCEECPFADHCGFPLFNSLDCDKYNLVTLKIKKLKQKV